MGKVSYTKLKLKVEENTQSIQYGENTIEVKQYLPIEDKYDLVMIALQKSEEDGFYNDIKLEMYFNLNLVYLYTNISFTEKQRENEAKLYNELQTSGLLNTILATIPTNEYESLLNFVKQVRTAKIEYQKTIKSVVHDIITDMTKNAEQITNLINNMDNSKFESVKDLIEMAQKTGINNDKVTAFPK